MKTSPFKIQGGVSPLKQNIPVDPMAGEGSVDSMVGNKKQSEIKYNTAGDDGFDDIAQFAPITGEITDAKNAIKDFVNKDYGGAALNMAGFFLPFVPGGVLKAGGKNIMNYLKKMPGVDAFLKSGKKMTKQQEVEFKKGFAESNGNPIVGGVGSNTAKPFDGKHLQNYGAYSEANKKRMQDMLRQKSNNLDEFLKGKGPTSYNKQNTRYLGKQGGRPIYEVDLPNGEKMRFYESTGAGNKVGSRGKYIPIEGTQTRTYPKGTVDASGKDISGQKYEWFNKDGSKATYKGKKYKGIFEGKDYISVKEQLKREGVDIASELKSGKLKIEESGYDFQYGKGFSDISKQLENIYPSRL